jgi:hypothetical protein
MAILIGIIMIIIDNPLAFGVPYFQTNPIIYIYTRIYTSPLNGWPISMDTEPMVKAQRVSAVKLLRSMACVASFRPLPDWCGGCGRFAALGRAGIQWVSVVRWIFKFKWVYNCINRWISLDFHGR